MAIKKKQKTETAVAKTAAGGAIVPYDYGSMAGKGMENITAADIQIPFLAILQSNSPEVDGSVSERKLEAASPGMFINTVTQQLTPGDTGFVFVPCATNHCYVEWIKRKQGGGYVRPLAINSPEVARAKAEAKAFNELEVKGADGVVHDLVETFYCVGLVLDEDMVAPIGFAILAFKSKSIKPYKRGIADLYTFSRQVPLFSHRLRITTVPDRGAGGSFMNYAIAPAMGELGTELAERRIASMIAPTEENAELLQTGEKLATEFLAGASNVNYSGQTDDAEPAAAGSTGVF